MPDDAFAASDALDADQSVPGGNEAILLVDDNPTLRDVTQRHLVTLGYQVNVAANGSAALAILRSGQTFDLLFTDILMPEGMSGYDLADAVRTLYPDLKVLFTTGYEGAALYGDGTLDRRPLLRKPYRREALAQAIRDILDAPAA